MNIASEQSPLAAVASRARSGCEPAHAKPDLAICD